MDNYSKYEKTIGLKSIWLTFVRRFKVILFVFVPISLVTIIFTQCFIKKSYQSSTTLYRASLITPAQYPIVYSSIKSYDTAQKVADKLASSSPVVTHSNGKPITSSEIYNGVSVVSSITSTVGTVTFTFQSSDSTICQGVLEEVANVAIANIDNAALGGTTILNPASSPTKNSKENTYMLIGLAAGFVLSLVFAFVDEVVSDEVYDKEDVEYLGSSAFEIATPKSKEK